MAQRATTQHTDIYLIVCSRALRNFAAGLINVAVALYMYTDLHYSLPLIGAVFAAASLAAPALTLTFGLASDIVGRKKMFVAANSLLVAATIMLLGSANYYVLVAASMLGGFGVAGTTARGGVGGYVAPLQNALIAEKTPAGERTHYFSLASLVGGVSSSLGALLVNIPDYHTLFLVGLVLAASATALALPVTETKSRRRLGQLFSFRSAKNIAKFSATGLLNGFGQGLVAPYFSVLFKSHYGLPNGLIGDLMGATTLFSSLALYFTPSLTRRLGFVNLISATRGAAALLLALFPFAPSVLLAAADYFFFSALRTFSMPAQQSLMVGVVYEEEWGAASSINQASRLVPSSAATLAAGYLFQDSFELPFLVSLPINLLNIALYNVFFRKQETGVAL